MLKSKLHNARITATLVDYEGSILIDEDLIKAANLLPTKRCWSRMSKVGNVPKHM